MSSPPLLVLACGAVCGVISTTSADIVNNPIVKEMGGLSTVSVTSVLGACLWLKVKHGQTKDKKMDLLERENHYLRKHLSATYKELYKHGYQGDSLMEEFDTGNDEK